VHVLARITFKPEAVEAAKALLVRLARESRKEAGCVSYAVYQQADQPHVFRTVEEWRDAAAAEAHMQTPHIAAAIATGGPIFAEPPEILPHYAVI
jgi:quinol monooxygenase YgiN